MAQAKRDLVFISYSHKDKRWLTELVTQLKPFMRQGSIKAWSDEDIRPGSRWRDEIEKALERTRVAVLLVTAHFLASDFIVENELHPLLTAAERGGVTIVWVPVGACGYEETPLARYQAVLNPATPLTRMRGWRGEAWVVICRAIKREVGAVPLTVVHSGARAIIEDIEESMAHGELQDSKMAPMIVTALRESKVSPASNYDPLWVIRGIRLSDEYFVSVRFGAGEIGWQRDFAQTMTPVLVGLARSLERSPDAAALLIRLCDEIAAKLRLRLLWPKKAEGHNDLTNRIYRESLVATDLESEEVLLALKELRVLGPR